MKRSNFKVLVLGLLLSTSISFTSCKGKSKETTDDNTTTAPTTTAPAPAPVEVSSDEALKTGVRDATKDYQGVNAEVSNGEITLTGEIQRKRLPELMQTLNSLQPKKINNNLKVK
jgi:osmotically-inducible protein OsmY